MSEKRVERRLAAILAADIAGYSRMMGADEEGTLARLKAVRAELIDPAIADHDGRIVKTTGDGMLVEFASVVDAMRCAIVWQNVMAERTEPPDSRFEWRIGINLGDVIIDGDDIFGDGVNIAARLEALAEPGGICVSRTVITQTRGKLDCPTADLGEQALKNIAQPVHVFRVLAEPKAMPEPSLPLPDKPSIAVLPFQNMSGDPEQEYFADGMVEEITTALSRIRSLFVIARNSAFTYKGRAVDVRQVGRELGVRYVLEGSVRKAGSQSSSSTTPSERQASPTLSARASGAAAFPNEHKPYNERAIPPPDELRRLRELIKATGEPDIAAPSAPLATRWTPNRYNMTREAGAVAERSDAGQGAPRRTSPEREKPDRFFTTTAGPVQGVR